MRAHNPGLGDGFVYDMIPLIKNGFVILRSILYVLIDRIEEAEQNRNVDVRRNVYSSIIDALELEILDIEKEGEDTSNTKAKIEVLEAVISVLMREMEELDTNKKKRDKRPRKVKIG